MVLKRQLFIIIIIIIAIITTTVTAQEAKPLIVGGEILEAEYPGNFGISYTEAKSFAQALGLTYWHDDARLIVGLGSIQIRFPISTIPKSRSTLKKIISANPPHALRKDEKVLIPIRYTAKALGCIYSGNENSLRVVLPQAKLLNLSLNVINGRDVISLKFDRNVNVVERAPGHWLLVGARAEEGMKYFSGLYLSDVRILPGPYGAEIFLDGVSGWPEEAAYFPRETRIFVGRKAKKKLPPPLIVIDPGHGGDDYGATYGNLYEKNIVLTIAKEMAELLRSRGYNVLLTRTKDTDISIFERAQQAAKADVFISIHVSGSPLVLAGPSIYTYTGTDNSTPVFTAKARTLIAGGGYRQILKRFAASPSDIEQFVNKIEAELGRIGLSAKRGRTPLYLLERAPGASALFEVGSIYNSNDRARMANSAQLSAYAQALARAIIEFIGVTR